MVLASFFNLGGPDLLILAFCLIVLVGIPAVLVYSVVLLVRKSSKQKPPPLPRQSPPPSSGGP
jgi:hypothetical protein